tara:strand:- start:4766 stop:5575 length:810 start_codon:yes stop_codon:yes gene_type:complete
MQNKNFDYKKIFSLKNKKIVILGGSGKMGVNFSKTLISAGAKVFLGDIKKNKTKTKAIYEYCDVSNNYSLHTFFNKLIKREKKLDTLIYNVYSKPKNYYKKFEKYDDDVWDEVIKTNLSGAYKSAKIITNHFKKKKISGNIIFVLSTYGIVGPDHSIYKNLSSKKNIYGGKFSLTTPAPYTSSKSGLLGLMKYLSTLYGRNNIRVNSLTPGGVKDGQEKKFVDNYSKKVPLARMAAWHEYNGAILFLSSDASSYMTGSNLIVDGGWTAW